MDQVYCFPSFLRQGKHIYVVAVPDEDGNPEYFSHRIIVRQREEDIPNFIKSTKILTKKTRNFNKNMSVFKDWQEDTPEILNKIIENDA